MKSDVACGNEVKGCRGRAEVRKTGPLGTGFAAVAAVYDRRNFGNDYAKKWGLTDRGQCGRLLREAN